MTGAKRKNAQPVLSGSRVKWTLEQWYQDTQEAVHIDWLRFTVPLDAVVKSDRSLDPDLSALDLMDQQGRDVVRQSRGVDVTYTAALSVVVAGARHVVDLLGVFEVGPAEDRGMDYYTARAPLLFAGEIVGYVLAGGKSSAQASTVHVNLFGSACLHVKPAAWRRVKAWLDESRGKITRVDIAMDWFTGKSILDVVSAYKAGAFDVRYMRPRQREIGSWTNEHDRTFEVGTRSNGKLMRAYEKGDEQFGHEANDPWVRYEVELRSNERVIDSDVLTRPADFFAGAYDFCATLLEEAKALVEARKTTFKPALVDVTAEAAVSKVVRNSERALMPTVIALWDFGGDLLADLVNKHRARVPKRLKGFARETLQQAFSKVAESFAPDAAPSMAGA